MSSSNGPSKAQVDQGVHEALVHAGFVTPEGVKDNTRLRETILAAVVTAKVWDKKDRADKAITRGDLVAAVFPDVAGPDSWEAQPDPLLASEVHQQLDKLVWGETMPNANKPLQRMVAIEFGNGYVLCRTKIGNDQASAVYVTDNVACIDADFVKPDNDKVDRAIRNATANREMLVYRQPDNAKHYVNGYKRTFRATLAAGEAQMNLALDAATADNADNADEADEADE